MYCITSFFLLIITILLFLALHARRVFQQDAKSQTMQQPPKMYILFWSMTHVKCACQSLPPTPAASGNQRRQQPEGERIFVCVFNLYLDHSANWNVVWVQTRTASRRVVTGWIDCWSAGQCLRQKRKQHEVAVRFLSTDPDDVFFDVSTSPLRVQNIGIRPTRLLVTWTAQANILRMFCTSKSYRSVSKNR